MLSCTEQISRAAKLKVPLGQIETVGGRGENIQGRFRVEQIAGGVLFSFGSALLFLPSGGFFRFLAVITGGNLFLGSKDGAKPRVSPASYTAAQLMELRQPESIGVFDRHKRGVGDIDPDFDDRGGDEHLDLA